MNEHNEILAVNYWEIIKQISEQNDISLRKAVEKYYELSGVPSREIYDKILNYLSHNSKAEPVRHTIFTINFCQIFTICAKKGLKLMVKY